MMKKEKLNITIFCPNHNHPVFNYLESWAKINSQQNVIQLICDKSDIPIKGDILFLISCNELIKSDIRDRFQKTLLIHASDLPNGKGWSPQVWGAIEDKKELCVTLLEAAEKVDSGDIWKKIRVPLEGHELYDEINELIFLTELKLLDFAVENFHTIQPQEQPAANNITIYPKRTPADSEIDINKSIKDQFNLIRISDPERYPAFFEHRGHKYLIMLKKITK